MSSKKWVAAFLATVLFIGLLLGAFNFLTDPFGAFGDPVMKWWGYDATNNPRVAKISYLEENHEKYDSYIIGCSSTSSLPVEAFNAVYGAKFYNLIMYDADMLDCEQMTRYLLDNYTVKNLVLNVYIDNGVIYHEESNRLTKNQHHLTDPDISLLSHASRYLFASPEYGAAKIKARFTDTVLPQAFDVFDEATGTYDKSARDAERIQDLASYLKVYPTFADYPAKPQYGLYATENCMKSVAAIKEMCGAKGVNLVVIAGPAYCEYLKSFTLERLRYFYTSLAQVTDYWDFSFTKASCEPRYFYDATHFRNNVGEMIAAKINGDEELWMPEDFGFYVTADNASAHVDQVYGDSGILQASGYSMDAGGEKDREVTIYTYHHIAEEGNGSTTMSAAAFEKELQDIEAAGYTTVTFADLIDYVYYGGDLPEKPLVITFDDGYASNYELAFPLLQKYGMKATIFVIGVSVGKEKYKDTDFDMTPHFGWNEAREMVESGLIDIQSHTYDMHQWADFEPRGAAVRGSLAQLEGESDRDYAAALSADFAKSAGEIENALGTEVNVVSYPNGIYNTLTTATLQDCGMLVSVTTEDGTNTLVRGLPQSLLDLKRISRHEEE